MKVKVFKLEIAMENAAFDDNPHQELARVLQRLAAAIEFGLEAERSLFDTNGNCVGHAKFIIRRC